MRRWIGRWILAVGVIHTLLGAWLFRRPLGDIARDGFWNAVDPYPGRPLAFWFVFGGLTTLLLGALIDWLEAQRPERLPAFLGWGLLGLGLAAAVLMPVSGGWLLLPPAAAAILRSKRGALARARAATSAAV